MKKKRIGFIAMSGVRAQNADLVAAGLTLPGFIERSKVIASLPSLSLLTLAGLTPEHFAVEYREIADLRAQAEALVLRAMQEVGTDTLGRYYAESLDWYFWKPRFVLSHLLGANRSARWIRGHIHALRRYLEYTDMVTVMTVDPGFSGQKFVRPCLKKIEAFRVQPGSMPAR